MSKPDILERLMDYDRCHEPEDVDDAREEIKKLRCEVAVLHRRVHVAVQHIAAWCVAVKTIGTGWDDWDEYYKDAACREDALPEIRALLTEAIADLRERHAKGGGA